MQWRMACWHRWKSLKGGANVLSRRSKILMYVSRAWLTLPSSISFVAVWYISPVSCKRNWGKCLCVFVIKLYNKHFLFCLKKICCFIYKYPGHICKSCKFRVKNRALTVVKFIIILGILLATNGPHVYWQLEVVFFVQICNADCHRSSAWPTLLLAEDSLTLISHFCVCLCPLLWE